MGRFMEGGGGQGLSDILPTHPVRTNRFATIYSTVYIHRSYNYHDMTFEQ